MAYEEFFNLLKKEHQKVKQELDQIQNIGTSSEVMRYWAQFKRDMVPHMKGEEKYFYPALQQNPDCQAEAEKAMTEHRQAESVMKELDGMSKGEGWTSKFSMFRDAVNNHIMFEEGEVFTKARQCLSESQLHDILNNFRQEEKRVFATM